MGSGLLFWLTANKPKAREINIFEKATSRNVLQLVFMGKKLRLEAGSWEILAGLGSYGLDTHGSSSARPRKYRLVSYLVEASETPLKKEAAFKWKTCKH